MSESQKAGHRQRLRNRFLDGEKDSRSEVAALELLLTYAIPQRDVRPLAAQLLTRYGCLAAVLGASAEDLCQIPGIKESSATLIILVGWLRTANNLTRPALLDAGTDNETQAEPKATPKAEGKPKSKVTVRTSNEAANRPSPTLFDAIQVDGRSKKAPAISSGVSRAPRRAAPRPRSGLFSKAVLAEAIELLPRLPDADSLEDARAFLRSQLHFSAETTRSRYASYITTRMFPDGLADPPMRHFAHVFAGRQELRDVCFYRFARVEPLMMDIAETLLVPDMGSGRVSRERVRAYLKERWPESKQINDCAKALADALAAGGVARVDAKNLYFEQRGILPVSLAFVLHSEFPEPGIYDLGLLENNRAVRAMLWNPESLLHALYELRNQGIISKISDIDGLRQFTTLYTLAEVVDQLASHRTSEPRSVETYRGGEGGGRP